jgi:hypothetical protein
MSNPQTLSPAQHRHSSKSPRQKKAPATCPGLSSSRHETTAQCAALCLCRRCTPEQPPACPCRPVIGPGFEVGPARQQVWKLGDVGGDASGLVVGEQLGRRAPSQLVFGNIGEGLPAGVADDEAGVGLFGGPGRREAACRPKRVRIMLQEKPWGS